MLYGDQPPQTDKQKLQKRWKVPQGVLKTNCLRTPRSSPPVVSASGLTTTCRILARAGTPFSCY